ncbi:hypothetical protein J1N51_14595 [Psychrosphaera ytuae]|uniref:Lipid/polyisoprenoid-binding YceI-like domain-containing protein n=1 Tax=Psychrosphaera ytuae TaxID=2820710 RepID=A0A975DB48_9GAMM|nr:hypothetical protein [Psychrosphaera ytuae]QTH63902.1 hypothetical protein J1N51_14595 [Psychrosphaera ytuae]
MKLILSILFLLLSTSAIGDDDFQWFTADGKKAPEQANQKAKGGLGGWLLITPDKDWEEKWQTPREHTPFFSQASDVKIGEELTVLPFFANPKLDNGGNFEIRCDIRVEDPEGTLSINEQDIPCAVGKLDMDPKSIFLTSTVIKFIGEEGDVFGKWTVYFDMKDVLRDVTVSLQASFNLVE